VAAVAAIGTSSLSAGPAGATPTVFTNSGSCVDDTYSVPPGISAVHVIAIGAAGGAGEDGSVNGGSGTGGAGGDGSQVAATVPVTPGQTLYVNVAGSYVPQGPQNEGAGGGPGGPSNGGFAQIGGPGGSASWVANTNPVSGGNCTPSSPSLLAVAAGGGGGGGASGRGPTGGAGGTEGTNAGHGGDGGSNGQNDGAAGSGATGSGGGGGGNGGYSSNSSFYGCQNGGAGVAGTSLQGGSGGNAGSEPSTSQACSYNYGSGTGGGGGGGYYGGGGGGGASDHDAAGGGGGAGSSHVIAGGTYDQPTQATTLPPEVSIEPVFTPPAIISSNASITSTVGGQINFQVQATGYPLPSIRYTGHIPPDVFLNDNGDGTANLVGSPYVDSGGEYDATLIADNHDSLGNTHETSQNIKIFVDETPDIYSNNSVYFNVGSAGSFTVQTQGSYPANPAITESGALPSGITLTDNHNGTATLSGTAAVGTGGVYPLTMTARNSAGQSTTQSFTLTIYPLPTVTTVHSTANPSASGESVTFSATVNPHPYQDYVEFLIDGVHYAFVSTDLNGVAIAPPTSSLSPGHHTITAKWPGDGGVESLASTGTLDQVVDVLSSPASGTSLRTSAMPSSPLYFEDGGNQTIYRSDSSGVHNVGDYYPEPSGIAFDPGGDRFTFGYNPSDGAPKVLKTTPHGAQSLQGSELSSISNSFGIGADAAGDAFVADNGWGQVDEETAGGTQRVLVSGTIPGEGESTYQLSGLAVDTAGDVFFSEDAYGKVYELSPPYTGTPQVIANGLNNPQGLAVDATGDLFIADEGDNKIIEVPAGGLPTTLANVSRPRYISVDASQNVFFSSDSNENIYELAAPYTGAPTVVVSGHTVGALASSEPATPVTGIQAYSLTATVISAPVGAAPTGTVTFSEGSTVLGTAALSGTTPDTATLAMAPGALGVGSHTITAAYGGNGSFPGSTSGPIEVDVGSPDLRVDVTGSQAVGGSNVQFADTLPTAPVGVSFSGSLSGCQTSVQASAAVGLYESTISNCGGVTLTGPNAAYYDITYVDSGFTVTLPQVTVDVTGTLPYQGTATYHGTVVNPPSGVTGISGTLHCSTTESNTAAFGTYQGTISGCSGVNLAGPNAANYHLVYSYGGLTVGPGSVNVTVKATQPYGGSPTFSFTAPGSFPSGVTGVTGSLSGCTTTVTAASNAATYPGTISGCSGLSLSGTSTQLWQVVYVDGAVTVTPVDLAVTVVGNQPYNNAPTYGYDQLTSPPAGVTGITGFLGGCTTTLSKTASIGYYPPPIIDTAGCVGLSATGPNGVDYTITYVDGGITVFPGPTGTTLSVSPSPAPDVYVTDGMIARDHSPELWKLAPPYSSPQSLWSPLSDPSGVAVDSSGDVFVADHGFGKVTERTPGGQTSVVLSSANAPDGNEVWGLAIDAHGNLFVTTTGGDVEELAFPYTGSATVIASGQYYPQSIAVDSADDVFFSTSPSQTGDAFIKVLTQPFTAAPAVVQDLGPYAASGLAVDPAGNLYWDTPYSGGSGQVYVEKVPPPYTGTPTNAETSATPKNPQGLALDSAGDLFFGDSTKIIIDNNPGKLWEVSGGNASSFTVGESPTAVAVDRPPSQVEQGTAVTLTATVISGPPGNSPAGGVNFYDGTTLLGEGTLSGGATDTATWVTSSLSPGTHDLTARYVGTANYPTSVSGLGTVIVYPSTVTIPVLATQTFGGTPTFSDTVPTTAPGVSVTGTLSGCSTSVSSNDHVGSYPGTISGCGGLSLTGPNASNYTLAYSDAGVTVNPATFSVGVEATRTYGGTTAFTPLPPALPAGINAITGSLTGCLTSSGATTPVGSYAGTISGCGGLTLAGPDSGDYTLGYTDDGLTISKAPLTVTVTGSQTYGGTGSFVKHLPTLPSGVTVNGSLTGCSTNVSAGAPAGSYPGTIIGCAGLSLAGSNAGDYTLSYVDGGFTVVPAPVSVSVTGTESYGGTATFVYGQPATLPTGVTGVAGTLTGCQTSLASASVGTYSGTISGCAGLSPTGPDASNYAVTYADGGLTVSAATLSVVPDDQSITYGQSDPSFTYTITGYQNSDTSSVVTTQPVCSVSGAHSDVGSYTIACSGGAAGNNYTFDDTATSTLTVGAAPVAVPVSATRTYGGSTAYVYAAPSTLPQGISGVTGSLAGCTTSAPPTAAVGAYGGTISGCIGLTPTGSNAANYAVTYTDHGLTVSAATLTVHPDNETVVAGNPDPSFTATITGFMNGQGPGVMTVPPVCGVAVAHSAVGTYPITCSGGTAPNYIVNDAATGELYVVLPETGYWQAASDGGIFSFGAAGFYGSMGGHHLNKPVVGVSGTQDNRGYWEVASDGGVFSFGDAMFWGSTGSMVLNKPIVGIAPTPDGGGYWLVASDGGVFAYGDATFWGSTGSMVLNKPIVGIAPTPDGGGYWLVASDGGVFAFGDALFHGTPTVSPGGTPVVGIAASPKGSGYWEVAADGTVTPFGAAAHLAAPPTVGPSGAIVGITPTADGGGYWLAGRDGGVLTAGNAAFAGSMAGSPLLASIVGIAAIRG
jgi:sugar lactone lactonase YvrE